MLKEVLMPVLDFYANTGIFLFHANGFDRTSPALGFINFLGLDIQHGHDQQCQADNLLPAGKQKTHHRIVSRAAARLRCAGKHRLIAKYALRGPGQQLRQGRQRTVWLRRETGVGVFQGFRR